MNSLDDPVTGYKIGHTGQKKNAMLSLATLPLLHNVWSFMAVFVPSNHIVNLTDNVSVSKHPE